MSGTRTCAGGAHVGVRGTNLSVGILRFYTPSGTLKKTTSSTYESYHVSPYTSSTWRVTTTATSGLDTANSGGYCAPPLAAGK